MMSNNAPSDPPTLAQTAFSYLAGGLSLVPIDEGTKRPATRLLPQEQDGDGNYKATWAPYQHRLPTKEELTRWLNGRITALAAVCGQISGGLLVLDFDIPESYDQWRQTVDEFVKDLPIQRTGGGGYHVAFRCPQPGPNQKLAWEPNDQATEGRVIAIETRGEGGMAVLAPSLHKSGNRYQMIQGDFAQIPHISQPLANFLIQAARDLDQAPLSRQDRERLEQKTQERDRQHRRQTDRPRVIDEYNRRYTIGDILQRYGYTQVGTRFARPGGSDPSVHIEVDNNRSYHHSTNDPLHNGLHNGYWQKPFDVFCYYEHNDDVKSAVKAAAAELELSFTSPAGSTASPSGAAGEAITDSALQRLASPESTNWTDLGNARRLVNLHGHDLLYIEKFDQWLIYNGICWVEDETGEIVRRAKHTVGTIYFEGAGPADETKRKGIIKWGLTSENHSRIMAMIKLARSEPGISVAHHCLNADPMLLNCLNGTIDLTTGQLMSHRRDHLITKRLEVEYHPEAQCPRWLQFLHQVMGGNQMLINFIQRAVGYTLTGKVSEQKMFFLYGQGHNGKSTFMETLLSLLGEFAQKAPTAMLMFRPDFPSIPNDIARLPGARLVVAAEVEQGRRLAESTVKDLTGGDTLSARFLRQEFFEFKPTHKLWMYGNHKPIVTGTDDGIWRRIILIPLSVQIPESEQDPHLKEKLLEELPGILAWAVQGCLKWQASSLQVPEVIKRATSDYRSEMDVVGAFIKDCCLIDPRHSVKFGDLYEAYLKWCADNHELPEKKRKFGEALTEKQFPPGKGNRNVAIRFGIALATDESSDV